jgi:hypothetical protein
VDDKDELTGKYLENYRAIWDLYINNYHDRPDSALHGDRRSGGV